MHPLLSRPDLVLTLSPGSKVKCSNCNNFGHTKVRCKEPPADAPEEDYGGGYDNNAGGNTGDSGAAWEGGQGGGDNSW